MPREDPRSQRTTLDDLYPAWDEARSASKRIALDSGAQVVRRPLFPGSQASERDVEPLAGARAARKIELGARVAAVRYVRDAREAGHTWQEIGDALGVVPGGDADQAGETVAEAAYTYVAGHPDTERARLYGRSFTWHCPSCDQAINDQGLIGAPDENEPGHTDDCSRMAAAVAEWDAGWEAEP